MYNPRELNDLEALLNNNNVSFKRVYRAPDIISGDMPMRNQIRIDFNKDVFISAICQFGSYGVEAGLIEVWSSDMDDPQGWLDANEAFELFADFLEKYKTCENCCFYHDCNYLEEISKLADVVYCNSWRLR